MRRSHLQRGYELYRDVIEASPHRKNIEFLVANPSLAERNLHKADLDLTSNCAGTAVFIIGQNREVKAAQDDYRGCPENPGENGDYIHIPRLKHPGYVGMLPIREIFDLDSAEEFMLDEFKEGGLFSFWWQPGQCDEDDCDCELDESLIDIGHVAVYLGKYGEDHIMFHQGCWGEPFGFMSLEEYAGGWSENTCNVENRTFSVRYTPLEDLV